MWRRRPAHSIGRSPRGRRFRSKSATRGKSRIRWVKPIAPEGIAVYNPAFDVTPAELITAIVCERGVIQPVNRATIAAVLGPPDSRWLTSTAAMLGSARQPTGWVHWAAAGWQSDQIEQAAQLVNVSSHVVGPILRRRTFRVLPLVVSPTEMFQYVLHAPKNAV